MLRLAFNNYFFATFTVLKAQYIVPSPPKLIKSFNLEKFAIGKIRKDKDVNAQQAKEIYESNKNEINQKYQKQYQEIQEAFEANKAARQDWKKKYAVPSKPIGEAILLRMMIGEKYNIRIGGPSIAESTKKVTEIMAQEKELVEQLKVDVKKIYQKKSEEYHRVKEEYKKKYEIPQLRVVSLHQAYTQGKQTPFKDIKLLSKGFKQQSEEELKKLQQIADQMNEENQKRLQKLSTEYGMSLEDFTKELKNQIKEQKRKGKNQEE